MPDPTHLIQLQKTLADYLHERRRICTELEELEHQLTRCRDQLATSDRMINQTRIEIQNALELGRDLSDGLYDPRSHEPRPIDRPNDRPIDRYDQRYDQRRDSRYDSREVQRYDSRYDKQNYRNLETPAYRTHSQAPMRPGDIDEALENIHRDEQRSNVRFADFRIPQAATIVLREANRPLHVSEIFRRLSQGGFEFRGQHQMITLAVSLSRSNRFRKVAPGTFELDPAYQAGQVA